MSIQTAGFIYAENAVRANVLLYPAPAPEQQSLPNVKGSVFEV
jgi:hypothetical protein